ncbi:hypothetical protein M3231_09335 [Neobacillus mesonae]|nr:hypothetical protein [Neobacillus mesonae]
MKKKGVIRLASTIEKPKKKLDAEKKRAALMAAGSLKTNNKIFVEDIYKQIRGK